MQEWWYCFGMQMHCQKNLPVCKCEDLQYRMNFHLVYLKEAENDILASWVNLTGSASNNDADYQNYKDNIRLLWLNLDFHGKENSFYWHKRMSRPLIEARSAPVQLYSKKDYQILFSKNHLLLDKDILSNELGKFDRKKKFIIMRTDLLVSASD